MPVSADRHDSPPPGAPHHPHHHSPTLGLLLTLNPFHLEKQFWRSTAGAQYLRSLDRRVCWLVLLNSLTVAAFQAPAGRPPAAHLFAALHIAVVCAQALASNRARYNRVPFVVALRASHLLQAILSATAPRGCPPGAPCLPFLLHSTHQTPAPLPWPLRTPALLATALLPALHSLQLPLTFRLALPAHCLYLLSILTACTAPTADVLRLPSIAPAVIPLCHAIDAASSYTMALVTGVPPPRAPQCTTHAAPWLVALFLRAAVGVLLPLVCCYVLEYRAKVQFLALEVGQPAGENAGGLLVLRGVLLLVGVAVVVWEWLLLTQARLPRWALVTSWEGCESAWFDRGVRNATTGQCTASG